MFVRSFQFLIATGLLTVVTSCGAPPAGQEIGDPFEDANREVHGFNKAVDRRFLGPVARGYGTVVPASIDRAFSNVAANLAIPGEIVNSSLQLNFDDVATNIVRFTTNTIFGLAGFFDVATALGVEEDVDTDFDETLSVYGISNGSYLELPFFGPRTERAASGALVDFFLNPVDNLLPARTQNGVLALNVVDKVGDRDEYDAIIYEALYASEDSYATTRSLYLQNRRFKFGGQSDDFDLEDPYAN